MTKTIALDDDFYHALRCLKEPGEYISDVVGRLARDAKRKLLLDSSGSWKNVDTDEALRELYSWRDESRKSRI